MTIGGHSRARVIGGVFGLGEARTVLATPPPFMSERALALVNARSGFWLVVERLAPRQVWLPSYVCGVLIDVLADSQAQVRFYAVDQQLRVADWAWVSEVQARDVVVLIDYFGFACAGEYIAPLQARGACVLEDASQALLSTFDRSEADFVLFSPRKFVGVPDGGVLHIGASALPWPDRLDAPPADWWLKAFAASLQRQLFDAGAPDRDWYDLFLQAEATAPHGGYAISQLSRSLLMGQFDYELIARRRVANYQRLLADLRELALFPDLPPGTVPLGFPIRVRNRDRVRAALFAANIFPPIHWPMHPRISRAFAASHQLAAEIMTIPCDQRYGPHDLAAMISIISQVAEP